MRFYLLCLGCPKNEVDAAGMERLLRQAGHSPVEIPRQAQVIIVNTCGFIDKARRESISILRKLAAAKRPGQFLIAAGCLPQLLRERLFQSVPGLDGLLGTRRWMEISAFLEKLRPGEKLILLGDPGREAPQEIPRTTEGPSAYLKIAEGCSAPCAFCTIPRIKGKARSRPSEAIIAEARELVERGAREITLIAQDITFYGRNRGEKDALPALIEEILWAVPELPWLRLMYAYPQGITPRLIEVMASHPQVCHYLDLPLQHAHPDVLRRMNRPHDVEEVRELIASLRQAMPDIALRTSFIVGYPGETEEEFAELLSFMEEIAFDRVGIFTYSREEGTKAAALPGQILDSLKEERYRRAMELQQSISLEKNKSFVGRTLDVLIEGCGDGLSVGRSYRDAPEVDGLVIIEGDFPIGEIVSVHITAALEYDLAGEAIQL